MKSIFHPTAAAITCIALAAGTAHASDKSIESFFHGKTIKIISGSEAGGGYDAYARLLARHMGRHIPGHPNFIVQNMLGAGGVVATNYVYNVAPQDGTVIAGPQRAVPFLTFFGKSGPQYDPVKINWLGSTTNEAGVLFTWHTSKVKTVEDALKYPAVLGSSGPNDTEIYPALMNNTLGTKFKIVTGYPSAVAVTLAMERGEVEGLSQSWSSLSVENPRFLNEKKVNLLAQISIKKNPGMAGVPLVMDFVKGDQARKEWEIMLVQKALGRPFALGPKVPPDRVKALRAAFMATMADKQFIADAAKQKREIDPLSGEEIQGMIEKVAAEPKALIAKLEQDIQFHGPKMQAKIALVTLKGKLKSVKSGGKAIVISAGGKEVTTKISGSRTKIKIDDKKAARSDLKAGMNCTVVLPDGVKEAESVSCGGKSS